MNDYNDGIIPEPCLRLDYGFGQEYASVELGDGTGYVRVTDELRGEYYKMQRWYDDELKDALAENAKLRELLGKYHYTLLALKEEDDNSPCPLYICPDTTICPWDNESCPFVEAINELGIEADE